MLRIARRIMKSQLLILLSASALWPRFPGAQGQGIRRGEAATNPGLVNEALEVHDGAVLPNKAIAEEERDLNPTACITRRKANPSRPRIAEQALPISATLFSGPPGPKACRGAPFLHIELTRPGTLHSTPMCYNTTEVAQCGHFSANKADGCQARIFSEPGCQVFADLAVFVPESRAFGGYVRSVEVRCGVISQTPPPLKLPGLKLPPGVMEAMG
ncbi:hypothetical protein F4777DRAFT_549270 [Nemania sp. FL0916]|nr:hypothetical protein F4777DRAFT_549270 [Nemania sp. FL0916]